MRATYQREMDYLERHLAFLASTGSVSPYVGLFGTVWGIMHAFRSLANVQQATLAQVAPGIAEALVATAIGLFAAIPAVVAYNRYSHDIDRLAIRFESFMEEFSNILQRQAREAATAGACADASGTMHEINVVPVRRRDAGAAGDLHGDRAAGHARRDRPADGRKAAQPPWCRSR